MISRYVIHSSGKAWINGEPLEFVPADTTLVKVAITPGKLIVPKGFKGILDDVRVYNRELTTAEMRQLADDEPIRSLLAGDPEKRSKDQKQKLREYYLDKHAPEYEHRLYTELQRCPCPAEAPERGSALSHGDEGA